MDICPRVGATKTRMKDHVLRGPWVARRASRESDVCAEAFPGSDPHFGSAGASARWWRSRCSSSVVRVRGSQDPPRGVLVCGDAHIGESSGSRRPFLESHSARS